MGGGEVGAWAQMTRPKVELTDKGSNTKNVYYMYLYMISVVDSSAKSV